MVETVEIEDVPEPVVMMLEDLEDKYGKDVVQEDLRAALRQAVASGYAQL